MSARAGVLVVDNSATMCSVMWGMLGHDLSIEVVRATADTVKARQPSKDLNADILTVDIEMSGLDGLNLLDKIMAPRPMNVVIVSSAVKRFAPASRRVNKAGAFDRFCKPTSFAAIAQDDALGTIVRTGTHSASHIGYQPSRRRPIIVPNDRIGFRCFPNTCPQTVIIQHVPALVTNTFANHLCRFCPPKAEEERTGMILKRYSDYLGCGGTRYMKFVGAVPRIRSYQGDPVSGQRPSINVLLQSVAKLKFTKIGVLSTGMVADGAVWLKTMRAAGVPTFIQDDTKSVVYETPRVAYAMGGLERQLPSSLIAAAALEMAA